MDLRASLVQAEQLKPGDRRLIPTGIYLELPAGYEAQVRPRSGLALKHGLTVLNAPGTIDADYRGEVKVLLINHGQEAVEVNNGDRVAQLIVSRCEQAVWNPVEELSETDRGAGGYGHTGAK